MATIIKAGDIRKVKNYWILITKIETIDISAPNYVIHHRLIISLKSIVAFGRKWLNLSALTPFYVIIKQMIAKDIIVDHDGIWQSIIDDFHDCDLENKFFVTTASRTISSDSILVWEFSKKRLSLVRVFSTGVDVIVVFVYIWK